MPYVNNLQANAVVEVMGIIALCVSVKILDQIEYID